MSAVLTWTHSLVFVLLLRVVVLCLLVLSSLFALLEKSTKALKKTKKKHKKQFDVGNKMKKKRVPVKATSPKNDYVSCPDLGA